MTIDWDKPIETTDGFPARVISKDYRDGTMTLVVVQVDSENTSFILRFMKDGTRMYHSTPIRNVKVKREGLVNVYSDLTVHGKVWETEEKAKQSALHKTIATAKIEWEE